MASAFLILTSENSPLPTGRVLMSEIAWIGAILGIGGLIGTVVVGWLADFAGRKNSLLLMAVPQIVRFSYFVLYTIFYTLSKPFLRIISNFLFCCIFHSLHFLHHLRVNSQISLMLIVYAQNVYYLYASRFLLGFVGGAVFVVIPLMVAEIAEDR